MASAFFTTIYVVVIDRTGTGSRRWFWDRTEAEETYDQAVEEQGDTATVSLYQTNVQQAIDDYLDEAMVNFLRGDDFNLQELRSNRKAAEETEATWTELVFRPDGCFTFERLKSPDYWPYIIEPYAGELARGTQSWRVLDATTATPIAIIRPKEVGTNSAFTVTVNGYSQTQAFNDLKSAAIYAATEYNG